jgi:hypothetical protein
VYDKRTVMTVDGLRDFWVARVKSWNSDRLLGPCLVVFIEDDHGLEHDYGLPENLGFRFGYLPNVLVPVLGKERVHPMNHHTGEYLVQLKRIKGKFSPVAWGFLCDYDDQAKLIADRVASDLS